MKGRQARHRGHVPQGDGLAQMRLHVLHRAREAAVVEPRGQGVGLAPGHAQEPRRERHQRPVDQQRRRRVPARRLAPHRHEELLHQRVGVQGVGQRREVGGERARLAPQRRGERVHRQRRAEDGVGPLQAAVQVGVGRRDADDASAHRAAEPAVAAVEPGADRVERAHVEREHEERHRRVHGVERALLDAQEVDRHRPRAPHLPREGAVDGVGGVVLLQRAAARSSRGLRPPGARREAGVAAEHLAEVALEANPQAKATSASGRGPASIRRARSTRRAVT